MQRSYLGLVGLVGLSLAATAACGGRAIGGGRDNDDAAAERELAVPRDVAPIFEDTRPPLDVRDDAPVSETITCSFANAVAPQRCWAGAIGCQGVGSCSVTAVGARGARMVWKSTCGGYGYTLLDGLDEEASFVCAPAWLQDGAGTPPDGGPSPSDSGAPRRSERVTCLFSGSTARQACWTVAAHPGPHAYGCVDSQSCVNAVTASLGVVLTWTSTCGGYAFTTVDGADNKAVFFCH